MTSRRKKTTCMESLPTPTRQRFGIRFTTAGTSNWYDSGYEYELLSDAVCDAERLMSSQEWSGYRVFTWSVSVEVRVPQSQVDRARSRVAASL